MKKLDTKVGKYLLNKKKGLTKKESAILAGYADGSNVTKIENSLAYKELEKVFYKDELLKQISLQEIAQAHAEIIRQNKDLGARNTAIKNATDKIESDGTGGTEEKVLVILKQ